MDLAMAKATLKIIATTTTKPTLNKDTTPMDNMVNTATIPKGMVKAIRTNTPTTILANINKPIKMPTPPQPQPQPPPPTLPKHSQTPPPHQANKANKLVMGNMETTPIMASKIHHSSNKASKPTMDNIANKALEAMGSKPQAEKMINSLEEP